AEAAGRRDRSSAVHRVIAVAPGGVGESERFPRTSPFGGRSALHGAAGGGRVSRRVRTACAGLLAAQVYAPVDVQAVSRLLAQQHPRRAVQPVAGENFVSLCDAAAGIDSDTDY